MAFHAGPLYHLKGRSENVENHNKLLDNPRGLRRDHPSMFPSLRSGCVQRCSALFRALELNKKIFSPHKQALLSALKFHRLTTQAPPEVWIALGVHAWRPRSTPFPVRTVYFSGAALTEGAETHKIDGVPVRIYSPAKTMADCFNYRNKIGAEIAVEALKDYLKQHPRGADALWRVAKVCRVSNVMRPHLEAMG
jgi:hypothetical protein